MGIGVSVSGSAPSPDFRKVESKPGGAQPKPMQQTEPPMRLSSPDAAYNNPKRQTALTDQPQGAPTESNTPTYRISDTANSHYKLFAIGANASKSIDGDPESATDSTVADLAELNAARADESITENPVEATDLQSADFSDSDELSGDPDEDEDRHHARGRRLDTLETYYRARFMAMERLVNDLIATHHLLTARFAVLPFPEKPDVSREST